MKLKTLKLVLLSPNVRKRTFGHMRPAKIQIIRAVWSESSLGEFLIAKDAIFLHAENEDSDQTAHMPKLVRVFVARTRHENIPL